MTTTPDTRDELRRNAGREPADGVLAVVAAQHPDAAPAALWAALSDAIGGPAPDAEPSDGSGQSTRSGVGRGLASTTELIEDFLDQGLLRVAVVDIGRMRWPERSKGAGREPLRDAIDAIGAARPDAEIRYLGPAGDDEGGLDGIADLVAEAGTGTTELVNGALERGFGRDPGALVRFTSTLREALPPDTAIVLRGSAVSGHSYTSGRPFDGAGPGTSDLDIVAIGDNALELFDPEARLFGGVNTLPLSDHAPWVAPALDPARRQCQEMVGRPVNIQVMARWFLDLRAAVQGQPYVDLFVPTD